MNVAPRLPSKTFYKRVLPSSCTAFSSKRGKNIFASALHHGGLKSFFALMEQHTTQSEPSFCGISTLVMVLNAFSVDPKQSWKGPWRWYHEEILNCCLDLEEVKETGITFPDFACLAICQGLSVDIRYAHTPEGSVEEFRTAVKKACLEDDVKEVVVDDRTTNHYHHDTINHRISARSGSFIENVGEKNDDDENNKNNCREEEEPVVRDILVVSYDRRTLGQTGSGHFSPLAAYDTESDSVLILDTARFKYGAHWVPLSLLHSAMIPQDPATGQSRGFALLSLYEEEEQDHQHSSENQQRHAPFLPVSMLFRYRFTDKAKFLQSNFLAFLKSQQDSVTWEEVYSYWTRDGVDTSLIWQMIEPQFKPHDAETMNLVSVIIDAVERLLPASAVVATAGAAGAAVDDGTNDLQDVVNRDKKNKNNNKDSNKKKQCGTGGTCRPNHSRTLPLSPIVTIFIVYLSALDKEERRKQVTSAISDQGGDGTQLRLGEEELLAVANVVEKFITMENNM